MKIRTMKPAILSVSLFVIVVANIHAVNTVTDSFVLEGGIEVTVEIDGDGSLLTIEVTVTNNSAEKVMLNKQFLIWGREPGFIDENGSRGTFVGMANRPIGSPFVIHAGIIDIIEPGEAKQYSTQRRYEQTCNRFALYDPVFEEDYNVFENPQVIKLVVSYDLYEGGIQEMRRLLGDIPIMPNFSRTYTLAEFGQ